MRRGRTKSLFDPPGDTRESFARGAFLLRGFALESEASIRQALEEVTKASPFRHMITPGGFRMSVAMTNCGQFGWVTDRRGYRYEPLDPETARPWPGMPKTFLELAAQAASAAGYPNFEPDACLINEYLPGSRLTLHQDRNEKDFDAPIVSVSLGLPATFLFGGEERSIKPRRLPLLHGDVAVWGGASRLAFHGVAPLKNGEHETFGSRRVNLTLRKAR